MAENDGITADQMRAARTLLRMTQEELAEKSGVSAPTVKLIEQGKASPKNKTLVALQAALEDAGIVFLADGEMQPGGAGVRLR